jgi:hypothetical protein
MASRRGEMEKWKVPALFDTLANHGPGDPNHWSASAELQRRRFVAQEALEQAQHAAINAQIEATEYAKQKDTKDKRRVAHIPGR